MYKTLSSQDFAAQLRTLLISSSDWKEVGTYKGNLTRPLWSWQRLADGQDLRRLEALILAMDREHMLIISAPAT